MLGFLLHLFCGFQAASRVRTAGGVTSGPPLVLLPPAPALRLSHRPPANDAAAAAPLPCGCPSKETVCVRQCPAYPGIKTGRKQPRLSLGASSLSWCGKWI